MYGELLPVGGGDPIPLLKKSLLVGRRESCDIVLRFSNVSAHHCQLTVNGGYWHVRDLQQPQRREGQRGAGDGQAGRSGRRPVDRQASVCGEVFAGGPWGGRTAAAGGRPSRTCSASRCWSAPGWSGGRSSRCRRPRAPTTSRRGSRSGQRRAGPVQVPQTRLMAKEKKIRADFRKNRNVRARRTDWTRQFDEHGFQEEAPPQNERVSGKGDLTRRRTIQRSRGLRRRRAGLQRCNWTWTRRRAAAAACSRSRA